MAYADQSMSGNRVTALIIVALLHVVLGYALVTGLAYEAAKKVVQRVTTVDIEEEVKKEEEPPPPPPKEAPPPPPVAPPPKVNIAVKPPPIQTVTKPPPAPPPIVLAPPAPVPPPPPPPPPPKPATPRNNTGTWVTTNDYPSRALREERQGVTRFRVTINDSGRVASCRIINSSGHPDLDEATCSNVTRRARFRPPSEGYGNTYEQSVRWEIPD